MIDKDDAQLDRQGRIRWKLAIATTAVLALGLAGYLLSPAIPGQSRLAYVVIWLAVTGGVAVLIALSFWRQLAVLGLAMLSGGLLTVCFAPWSFWPVAYVALIPFVWACHIGQGSKATVWLIGLAGVAYWATSLYWLTWITAVGHAAGTSYIAMYWVVAAWALRRLLRGGWPCWLALPLVWVPLELLRNFFVPFPWFFLAHSQYMHTSLIQISDVTGQLGVSFFVAMVNGVLVDGVLMWIGGRPRGRMRLVVGGTVTAVCLAVMLVYGHCRLSQDTQQPGPVVAVVQAARPATLYDPANKPYPGRSLPFYVAATEGLSGAGCDLVVWPESVVPIGLIDVPRLDVDAMSDDAIFSLVTLRRSGERPTNVTPETLRENVEWFVSDTASGLAEMQEVARVVGCPILVGGPGLRLSDEDIWQVTNDAVWIDPAGEYQPSYSKLGLVPFSEYLPFRRTCRPVFDVLKSFVPEGMRYTEPGTEVRRFTLTRGQEQWTLAAPICFEGTISRIARRMVFADGRKQTDILVNLSNDGWFVYQGQDGRYRRSAEHMAHFVPYVFRAVENRVPVIRSVNTGISGWIDSDGRVVEILGGKGSMASGSPIAPARKVFGKSEQTALPEGNNIQEDRNVGKNGLCSEGVMVDDRVSIYSSIGDAFAWIMALVALIGITATSLLKERVKT